MTTDPGSKIAPFRLLHAIDGESEFSVGGGKVLQTFQLVLNHHLKKDIEAQRVSRAARHTFKGCVHLRYLGKLSKVSTIQCVGRLEEYISKS